jgi:TonB-dependent SusC/RagA subfamily outer membrane receptor
VVKGAAAASLYGSQAANGVIQITTKRGRMSQNGVKFGLRSEYGASDIEREIGIAQRHGLLMDPTQTRFCINNGLSGTTGVSRSQAQQCQRTVDWLQENLRINDNTLDYATATTSMAIDLGSAVQGNDTRRLFQTNPWPGANYNAVQQLVQPKPLALATST